MKDSSEETEVGGTFVVEDYDTLKVLADPLRAQIVELLIQQSCNVRQIAERLGLAPSKLYYHFGLLEKIGLIQVVETRMVANMVEKQYRATASSIEVDHKLLTFNTPEGKESVQTLLSSTLDNTREDILRSLHARTFNLEHGADPLPRRVTLTRVLSRISEECADDFHARLKALVAEFDEADLGSDESAQAQAYALTIALYPSYYYHDPATPDRTSNA